MAAWFAFLAGLAFGGGLVVSGMANPQKVLGFLDLAGSWDPSLAFVMAGATGVGVLAFAWAKRRSRSWLGLPMQLPAARAITVRLVAGSAAFGAGWGLAGFCSGARDRVDRLRIAQGDRLRRRDAGGDGCVRVDRAAPRRAVTVRPRGRLSSRRMAKAGRHDVAVRPRRKRARHASSTPRHPARGSGATTAVLAAVAPAGASDAWPAVSIVRQSPASSTLRM